MVIASNNSYFIGLFLENSEINANWLDIKDHYLLLLVIILVRVPTVYE